jgi:hypothetical protein
MNTKRSLIKHLYFHFWTRACQHDSIPHTSKFVVFSDSNPFAPLVNRAAALYFA